MGGELDDMAVRRAPREVREKRLGRFLRQKEQALASVTRIEQLVGKLRTAEELETDSGALRNYIQTRLDLQRQLSSAQVALLRSTKSVDRERAWLKKYDEEEDTGGDGPVDKGGALSLVPEARDGVSETMDAAGNDLELLLDAVAKLRVNSAAAVTVGQIELILKYYSLLSNRSSLDPNEEDLKATLGRAMDVVDERLSAVRRQWVKSQGLELSVGTEE